MISLTIFESIIFLLFTMLGLVVLDCLPIMLFLRYNVDVLCTQIEYQMSKITIFELLLCLLYSSIIRRPRTAKRSFPV